MAQVMVLGDLQEPWTTAFAGTWCSALLEYMKETFPPLEPDPEESERDHST